MADRIEIEIMPTYTSAAVESTKKFFSDAYGKGIAAINKSGIGAVGREAKAIGGMVASGAGAVGGALMSTVSGPLSALTGAADLIGKFINAINPAVMEQFNMAMQDVFAVVGQALLPVFRILTPAMQMLGDYVASILPDLDPLVDAMKPLLGVFQNLYAALAPIINSGLSIAVEVLVKATEILVGAFQMAAKAFAQIMVAMLKIVPSFVSGKLNDLQKNLEGFIDGEDIKFKKTARGASGQGASYISGAELSRSNILAGFSSGMGANKTPTDKNTEDIAKTSAETLAVMREVSGSVATLQGGYRQ